jgi:hypothetical protein
MSRAPSGSRPPVAEADEDPNAGFACSSPPCFMHELDPSWLGYLSRTEVLGLLDAVLSGGWAAEEPDGLRQRLRAQRAALAGIPAPACGAAAPEPGEFRPEDLERLRDMIREALPRLYDEGLRRDLGDVLPVLDGGAAEPAEGG